MEIDIHQKKISFCDEYQIYVDGQPMYFAASKPFRWLTKMNLFANGVERARYTLFQKWDFLNASFNLVRWDGNILRFRTQSFWKNHYTCQVGADLYDIYGHTGRKHSIFKSDIQVGWWDKDAVSWFDGDNYKIIADNDSDYELIITFCLILDSTYSNNSKRSTVTIDFGNIGFQARKFDTTWQPKF